MSSISVIVPAYNAEKFIGEAIESALNQTCPAKEIVVADGSPAEGGSPSTGSGQGGRGHPPAPKASAFAEATADKTADKDDRGQ